MNESHESKPSCKWTPESMAEELGVIRSKLRDPMDLEECASMVLFARQFSLCSLVFMAIGDIAALRCIYQALVSVDFRERLDSSEAQRVEHLLQKVALTLGAYFESNHTARLSTHVRLNQEDVEVLLVFLETPLVTLGSLAQSNVLLDELKANVIIRRLAEARLVESNELEIYMLTPFGISIARACKRLFM
jgi:hypothetical protein